MSLHSSVLDTQPIPPFETASLLQQWWHEVQFQLRMVAKSAALLEKAAKPDDILQCITQMEICRYEIETVPFPPSFLNGRFFLLDALVEQVKAYSAVLYDDTDAAEKHRRQARYQMTCFEAEAAKLGLTMQGPTI